MSEAQKYLARFPEAMAAAREHAKSVYPEESCGFIVKGKYIALKNIAADPSTHTVEDGCECRLCSFAITDADYLKHAREIEVVVHSHPNGPAYPSKSDMLHQHEMDVAWAIVTLDETRFGPTVAWGGNCPVEPVIGREFVHGVTDCYSLIHDVYGLGREKLAEQGIDWPFDPIELPIGERDDNWWMMKTDNDLYETNYPVAGFREISAQEVRPGDVFLGKISSNRLNHGGLLLSNNLILHHLPNRLSRREPAGIWARCAEKWLRYEGKTNA